MHDHAPVDTLQPMLASTHGLTWCSFPIPACQHGPRLPNLHCHDHHDPAPAPSFWTVKQTSCPAVHGRDLPMPAVSSPHVHGHCSCISTTCCCLSPSASRSCRACLAHKAHALPTSISLAVCRPLRLCLAPAGHALLLAASLHLGYKKPPRRPLKGLANSEAVKILRRESFSFWVTVSLKRGEERGLWEVCLFSLG